MSDDDFAVLAKRYMHWLAKLQAGHIKSTADHHNFQRARREYLEELNARIDRAMAKAA